MRIPGEDSARFLEAALLGLKGTGEKGTVRSSGQSSEKKEGSASDAVEISGEARIYQQLQQQIASVPDIRAERVQTLREKIEAGTYRPSGEEIAEKLIRSTLLDEIL
ncbi:MAG: flagellar biosynthesis anti-sigma factor FlgM [Candidatus Manganitrophaceae bacterium]